MKYSRVILLPALLLCALAAWPAQIFAQAAATPKDNWNIVLTPVVSELQGYTGLDYHQPSRKLILSANAPAGDSNSFELLAGDGSRSGFSNVAGLQGEVLVATARDDGQGMSRGGFQTGTLFASTGTPGVVARISADGAAVQSPWVVLPGEAAPVTGLHVDRTGVFGGDLIAVTATGGVWRVSSSGIPARLAALGTSLAGVAVVPDDPARYGPWAGRILAGAKEQGSVYAVDAQGQTTSLQVGFHPQDIDVVPANENLYAIDPASRRLLGAAEGALTSVIGDILVTQGSPGLISRVRWDGTGFAVAGLAEAPAFGQVAFSPSGAGQIPAVRQVYERIAVVRHAPQLDSGRVEGALRQLTGEDTLLDGTDTITSDLLVPGTPAVTAAASASYGGTVEGSQSSEPSNYTLTLQGSASLRHAVTRTDPVDLQDVAFPPAPAGTRDVKLRGAGDVLGDPATLRHLDVSGNTGSVAVPPGTYGRFTVSGRNALVLGVEGSATPALYNLEELALTGGSQLRLAGPVRLRVRNSVTLVGSTAGMADDPKRLRLEVAEGFPSEAVKIDGTGVLYAVVRAPRGTVTIEGSGRLRGTVACDVLRVDGNGVLQITENDIPPPPVNRPPTAEAGPEHTITLPTDTVALEGTASDDGLPSGSTLEITWTKVSGPGPVTFADPHSAATSATFAVDGEYVLKLTASDGQLSSSDTVTVTVIPRNQPPAVDAGQDQTVELPAAAELHGSVTDDALPRGSSVTATWSVAGGPGEVTFADPHAAVTTASFSAPGTYTLRLSASDTEFTVADDVVITVIPPNQPPAVDAGQDQTLKLPAAAELHGTVTDDGLPRDSAVTVTWSVANGPGAVTFADPHAAVTTASFSIPGVYTLRLSASDTELTAADDVTVTVLQNEAPAVNAGPDQEITLPSTVLLAGTASDDGLPNGSTLEVFWTQVSGPVPVIFHDAFAAATPVTITAAGTYVLRLTASDSELSASDELTIVVHPKPNGPPRITSQPVTELLLGAVPTGGGEVVSLAPWTVKQYELNDQPDASWQRDATNTVVTQIVNADSSFLLSDFNLSNAQMEGTWRVNTSNDDDFIGFVFGYQGSEHFYLFDWKQASQNDPLGFAERGMSLKVVSAESPLTGFDFWPTAGNGTRVRTLYHNTIGWADFTDYQFTLQFYPGEIRIIVKQGATVLADFTVHDSTYTNGRFGFYNYSQEQVKYSGFRRLSLAQGTYVYDVDATDPDGDPLTYSLEVAPPGMTIDPATGLITWPVASAVAGDHQVVVRATEPGGGFDRQSYTLTILNPNEPPAVNAGDDRLITTGGTASLNGTAADDGFPRNSTLGVSWSKVSGPGTVSFANPSLAATTATFSTSGVYLLRLTANDGELSASDEVTVTVNTPPVVNAGPDQTLTQSNTAVLNGSVTDDGVPSAGALTILWSQVSGPGTVSFGDPGAAVTRAIFPGPGTYTLRLTGNDSLHSRTDDVTVTVNSSPDLDGATLALVPGNVGPYATGSSQPLRATLRNSAGNPLANYAVELEVTGPNATTGSTVTDASGTATLSYTGTSLGTDTVRAFVRNTTAAISSPTVEMTWTQAATSPPAAQGWIGVPLNGSTATGVVPVTVGAGVTLTQGTVEYWPAANPSAVTVLAASTQGGPGATVATLDTTLLANGDYVIRLRATDSNGEQLVSQVMITVAGESKPGRMTLSITDLTVPVTGIPITITRHYDSLERNQIGDFGYGWSLEIAGPRLEVSSDYDVTITEPGTGRRVTFQFAPTSFGFPFGFLYQPSYLAEPGVYGKLASNGCSTLIQSNGGVACYLSSDLTYRPTVYTYTDPYGRVYTMTAAGQMQSIKDLNGNVLTFSATGITSSAGGLNVPFLRDAQGRITQITDPEGKTFRYSYDAAGDLSTVELPDVSTPISYTYDPGHFFSSSTDPRGNTEASSTYRADGRLASVTDAVGNTTSYDYDLAANKTIITYPDGGVAIFMYAANGLLLSQTDPLNHTATYTYDGNRNKLTEVNALQQTTTYTYDASGNLASTTDPAGKTIRWTYNPYGVPATTTDQLGHVQTTQFNATFNPVSIADSLGTRVAFTWDAHGNPLTSIDGNGKVTRFTYDAQGHVLTKTDPLGRVTSYTYDGMGRVLTMTDARGTTRSAYDALGRLLTLTDPLGQVTRFEYDDNGNKTAQVDAAGRRTAYEYDAANRLIKVMNPDTTVLTYTYNFRGQRLTETDQDGHTTSYVYDKAGRRVKVINPDLTEITSTFDAINRLISETDERGHTTRYEYDPGCGCRERLTKIIDPLGRATSYTFDAAGRRTSETDASQRETRFDYDVRNRLIQTTYADGKTTQQTYDGASHRLTAADQAGRVTRFAYDDVGNLVSVTDALNQATVHSYDALNNLLSTTDALGRTTSYEYDSLNRIIKRALPLGMFESFTYDPVGNRATRTDFRGKQTRYDYDPMNRLVKKTPDASLGEPSVSYTYNPAGQRASMTDASGTTLYTYDARHRLSSKQTPQGTLSYTYDAAGDLASVRSSNANGISVDYTYDDLNRIESVVDNRLAGSTTTTYSYDAVGNTFSATLPNGLQTTYAYDSLYRPTQVTHSRGSVLAGYTQTLDETGRRLSVTENNGRGASYTYDALYRLTGETVSGDPAPGANGSVTYTYDPVGNRLSRASTLAAVLSSTSAYDTNDRLTADLYDANGDTRWSSGFTYTYDSEDQLKSANGGAIRIVYDGDGNRVSKTAGGVTTQYLVDDLSTSGYSQVVEELVAGSVQHTYTYGNHLISQSQQRNGGWQISFYGHDAHGNVRFLTDASGVVTDTYAYDAFGILTSATGTTPNNYLFNGQQYDRDLGFYFQRARYYNQDRGRFLTMDPVAGRLDDPMTLHKYMFGHADPVNRIDPSGTTDAAEYGLTTRLIALRTAVAEKVLGDAISCVFYHAASAIDPSFTPPLIFQACASKGGDDCDDQYEADSETCRSLPTPYRKNRCWRSASLRYGNCIHGQPNFPELDLGLN
jgi:RHS repeat-associated protein